MFLPILIVQSCSFEPSTHGNDYGPSCSTCFNLCINYFFISEGCFALTTNETCCSQTECMWFTCDDANVTEDTNKTREGI
jgi:hypothetical protein